MTEFDTNLYQCWQRFIIANTNNPDSSSDVLKPHNTFPPQMFSPNDDKEESRVSFNSQAMHPGKSANMQMMCVCFRNLNGLTEFCTMHSLNSSFKSKYFELEDLCENKTKKKEQLIK